MFTSRIPEERRKGGGFRAFGTALTSAILNAEAAFKRSGQKPSAAVATRVRRSRSHAGRAAPFLSGGPRRQASMGKTAMATNIAFCARGITMPAVPPNRTMQPRTARCRGFIYTEMSARELAVATRDPREESGCSPPTASDAAIVSMRISTIVQASQQCRLKAVHRRHAGAERGRGTYARPAPLKRQPGLGLIVIDSLQLLRPRNQEPAVKTIAFRKIAGSPGGLLKERCQGAGCYGAGHGHNCQSASSVRQAPDVGRSAANKGSIEKDADVGMFIYSRGNITCRREPRRPFRTETEKQYESAYQEWRERLEKVHGLGEIIVAKQRHGPIGAVKLRFDAAKPPSSTITWPPITCQRISSL